MVRNGRPEPSEFAPHAEGYVALVTGSDVLAVLQNQLDQTISLLNSFPDDLATTFAYEAGKWTVKQVLGHMSDTERIFTYRALCLARNDTTPLPGFEQNEYVAAANSNGSSLTSLIEEFKAVRAATLALYQNLPDEAWLHSGRVSEWNVTVRGIAYTTAGHELHHCQVFRERYLPAVKQA